MALVIFAGGLLIYAWRGLHGENLAKPPKFDLSVYENTTWYTEAMEQAYSQYIKSPAEPFEQKISSGADLSKTAAEFIHFKKSFCDFAGPEALPSINNFLAKFPELQGREVEFMNQSAEFCAKISLAEVTGAEGLMEKIQKDYSDLTVIR